MVRTKLNLLQQEIEHYIGLPYSKNIIKNGKIIKEQFLGGKGNKVLIEPAWKVSAVGEQREYYFYCLCPQ